MANGGIFFIHPSEKGQKNAMFIGLDSPVTYFGSFGSAETFKGSSAGATAGADVGFVTRLNGSWSVQDERMRIKGDTGNVGIGTVTPSARLHVAGDGRFDGPVEIKDLSIANKITGNNGFGNQIIVDDPLSGDGIIRFFVRGPWAGDNGTQFLFYNPRDGGVMRIKPSNKGGGNAYYMGIDSKVTYFGSYGCETPMGSGVGGKSADVGFFTRAIGGAEVVEERMRIKGETGNVGIGTVTPSARLHVAGDARFEGPVRIQPAGDLSMGDFTAKPTQKHNEEAQEQGEE